MASSPWVTPSDVTTYTDYSDVKNRATGKLEMDIMRAELWITNYCNNDFSDDEAFPSIPKGVRMATIILANAYAHNAVETSINRKKSETYDDYSYTIDSSIVDMDSLDINRLLDPYVTAKFNNAVSMRMRVI